VAVMCAAVVATASAVCQHLACCCCPEGVVGMICRCCCTLVLVAHVAGDTELSSAVCMWMARDSLQSP
jgi:hypothetical protein